MCVGGGGGEGGVRVCACVRACAIVFSCVCVLGWVCMCEIYILPGFNVCCAMLKE